jgi:hypothetical protein
MDPMTDTDRGTSLLSWQWSIYATGHRDRRNLVVHALTVPFFLGGTCALVFSPVLASGFSGAWVAVAALLSMVAAVGLQGRGHALEATRPVPFEGPLDVVARIFAEQWITFPRYVLSGGYSRAWGGDAGGDAGSRSG